MINQFTKYQIKLEYSILGYWCILIKNADTGKALSFQEYDEWIQYVGGNPEMGK